MPISSLLGSSALLPAGLGFRNKIMNGDFRINQRGTGVTAGSASKQFMTDRWVFYNGTGTVNFQQSTVAPAGFTNSLQVTNSATPASYGTNGYTEFGQFIEGFNTSDLAWGTASAKPIVISFWVQSSITGVYNIAIQNNAQNRSYIASFTVNTANTWEYKTVFINGDTTGTWLTDNNVGLRVWFQLGMGTAYDTTGNTWVAGNLGSTSNAVDFAATANATFYVTGVQLEQNYQPTPFEQRPIGVELQLCQRYYWRISGATAANVGLANGFGTGAATPSARRMVIPLPVPMRAKPTPVIAGTHWMYNANLTNRGITSLGFNSSSPDRISVDVNSTGATTTGEGLFWVIDSSSANDYLEASGAEL